VARTKLMHPGWECCTKPDLLRWWVWFEEAWCRERMAIARDMYKSAEPLRHVIGGAYNPFLIQAICGEANALAQGVMMRRTHAQRVAEAHGIPWPDRPDSPDSPMPFDSLDEARDIVRPHVRRSTPA
jgi:hypothetical protein